MSLERLAALNGMKVAKIYATYFMPLDGNLSEPISIIIKDIDHNFIEIMADNNGGIRIDLEPFQGLYYDPALGYSFIAPLIIVFKGRLDGSEMIESFFVQKEGFATILTTKLNKPGSIEIKFEDDEMYFTLK